MKRLNHLETDGANMANGLFYYIGMAAILLIMFFLACYVLNGIIDTCLAMLENLAEAVRIASSILPKSTTTEPPDGCGFSNKISSSLSNLIRSYILKLNYFQS